MPNTPKAPLLAADQATPPVRLRLRLRAAAESVVRAGHPWVFANSIAEQNREGGAGELAVIYDRNDKFLAVGLYDPDSPIRLRVLHAGKPQTIDAEWWRARLDAAVTRRAGLFDEHTTGYRLINGESDGWPGLVLDRYDATLVLKVYTAAWLAWLDEIIKLISEQLQPERVVLRLSRNIQNLPGAEKWKDESAVFEKRAAGDHKDPVIFSESGLRFEAEVWKGQKTGFFLDQRENRRLVETFAVGRTVLNAFSFSGGFSLYAARGGAKSVTDLDISKHALASAARNFALNQSDARVAACRREAVQANTYTWLAESDRSFNLMILDPPSLAKREAERAGAIRAYSKLVDLGLKRLARDGILLACSCSAHVTADEFFTAVRQTARNSHRKFTELRTTHHAPDHHATFAEAEYLKGIYLQVG